MFTAITKINGSTMDVELQVLSRFFSGAGGVYKVYYGQCENGKLES